MKIVINTCYGGFSVSKAVYEELGIKWDGYGYLGNKDFGIESEYFLAWRADTRLIDAIEKIGNENSSGKFAKLKIVNIPDDIKWEIDDYDGWETIEEVHRSWD